jgi:hypothetical protein
MTESYTTILSEVVREINWSYAFTLMSFCITVIVNFYKMETIPLT